VSTVIARTWRGWTKAGDADAYVRYIDETGMAAYTSTPGNRGAWMLRRELSDGRTEFVTFSLWVSMDAVRAFAGDESEKAVFYPEDDRFLVDRETTVSHYEVASEQRPDASASNPVSELRVAYRVDDFQQAVEFWRDGFGLPVVEEWARADGSGMILDGGRATLELLSSDQVAYIDQIEAGGRPEARSASIRLAMHVPDSAATADQLEAAGAQRLGGPVVTPWKDRNVRLRTPGGLQLTLFTPAGDADG